MYRATASCCLIAVCILAAASTAVADVVAQLHALPDPDVRLKIEYRADAVVEPVETTSIRYGDVLALRITLHNDSDKDSAPLVAHLGPDRRPAIIVIQPDGKEYVVDLFSIRRTVPPRERIMGPDEKVTIDIFIYRRRPKDDLGREMPDEYVFPKPGTYQLYFRHFPDDAWTRAEKDTRNEPWRAPLVSNRVTVQVGPAIPGWEQLREAGIVHAVGSTDWPNAFESPQRQQEIERLIVIANRRWLTRWFEEVKEHRRKREEERQRLEEERRRATESSGEKQPP